MFGRLYKWTVLLMAFLVLAACSPPADEGKDSAERVIIHVTNNTDFPLYAIEINFYQDGVLRGTQGMSHAGDSKVRIGETLWYDLLDTDLDLTEEVELEVSVLENPDSTEPLVVPNRLTLQPGNQSEHFLQLTGTKENLEISLLP